MEILFSYANKTIIFLIILLFSTVVSGQNYYRGLILESVYNYNVSRSPLLSQKDYSDLPPFFSLKHFAPEPGDQGPYSTCGAWATSYSARSLSFIISNNIPLSNKKYYYFSPSFVYNQLKRDDNCTSGISLKEALDILKDRGTLFLSEFGYSCDKNISNKDLIESKNYSILEYREIFSRFDKLKISKVKKSLSEYKPVIIALACPISFEIAREVWIPNPEDFEKSHDGHAVVVIGYDDQKFGGSFEILNSWGTNWGENGYCWIKYSDFEHFAYYGYDLIEKSLFDFNEILRGSVYIKLLDGSYMPFENKDGILTSTELYTPQTKFEIFVTNYNPIYLYCLSFDNKSNFSVLFPKDSLTNNLFPYKSSTFPIPDEIHYLELDNIGTEDYLVMIFSRKPIKIGEKLFEKDFTKMNYKEVLSKLKKFTKDLIFISIDELNRINYLSNDNTRDFFPVILRIRKSR